MKRRTNIAICLMTLCSVFFCTFFAYAQDYPDQPIVLSEHGEWIVADQLDEFDDPSGHPFAMTAAEVSTDAGSAPADTETDALQAAPETEAALPTEAVSPDEVSTETADGPAAAATEPETEVPAPEYRMKIFYAPEVHEFAFRLLLGEDVVPIDAGAEVTLKFKWEGEVYESPLVKKQENSELYLAWDSGNYDESCYYSLKRAIASGSEFKSLLYIGDVKYSFTVASDGFAECEDELMAPAYEAAAALFDAGEFADAQAAFEALYDYRDSAGMAARCETALQDAQNAALREQYDAAAAAYNNGSYEEAAVLFRELGDYEDSAQMLAECEKAMSELTLEDAYQSAVALAEEGQYKEAIAAFEELDDYEDAADQIEAIRHLPGYYLAADVGDTVYLGTYEQDNDPSDGEEEIEWMVLDRDGTDLLLLSKYALECAELHPANSGGEKWDEFALRIWMNRTFLQAAFAPSEIEAMRETAVVTEKNNDTFDRLFLLDYPEVMQYFARSEDARCMPTEYAAAQGVLTDEGSCGWWTRSLGSLPGRAYIITGNEGENYYRKVDDNCSAVGIGLRPAMWIDAQKLAGTEELCPDQVRGTLRTTQGDVSVEVGKTVLFGSYEQDNDSADGSEPIEWTVLEVRDGKALLLSVEALECMPFNTEKGGAHWDISTVRTWLNSEFPAAAFTPEEQSRIPATAIVTEKNEDTNDKIFLFDRTETETYFASTEYRRCMPTPYALSKGAATKDGTCQWYLRTPENSGSGIATIMSDGTRTYLQGVKSEDIGIRPALWAEIETGVSAVEDN